MANHLRRAGCQQGHAQAAEIELAHSGGIGVILLVIGQRGLPAIGRSFSADEHQRIGLPVTLHEAGYVAPVPSRGLGGEHLHDGPPRRAGVGGNGFAGGATARSGKAGSQPQQHQYTSHQVD